jgi:hypothetical protein
MPSRARTPLLLALLAALVAGCGGGGGGGGGNENDSRGVDTGNTVYQAAHDICSADSAKELEQTYRTPSDSPEDIAEAIATNLAGGIPVDEEAARQGCIDGLESQK